MTADAAQTVLEKREALEKLAESDTACSEIAEALLNAAAEETEVTIRN
ncbi:MAG: hypothetical protein V5A27_08540 [Halapricum sp.]